MDKKQKKLLEELDSIENMSESISVEKAKSLIRILNVDKKVIEDNYINTRKELAELIRNTLDNSNHKTKKKELDEEKTSLFLKYLKYTQQEAMLDYNSIL